MRRLAEIVAQGPREGDRPPRPEAVERPAAPDRGGQVHPVGDRLRLGPDRGRAVDGTGRGGTPRGEQQRLALRGAHTPLYASPAAGQEGAARPARRRPRPGRHLVPAAQARPARGRRRSGPSGPRSSARTGSPTRRRGCCRRAWPPARRSGRRTPACSPRCSTTWRSRSPSRPTDGSTVISLKPASGGVPPASPGPRRSPGSSRRRRPRRRPMSRPTDGRRRRRAGQRRGCRGMVSNSIGMTFALIPAGHVPMGSRGRRAGPPRARGAAARGADHAAVLPVASSR